MTLEALTPEQREELLAAVDLPLKTQQFILRGMGLELSISQIVCLDRMLRTQERTILRANEDLYNSILAELIEVVGKDQVLAHIEHVILSQPAYAKATADKPKKKATAQ